MRVMLAWLWSVEGAPSPSVSGLNFNQLCDVWSGRVRSVPLCDVINSSHTIKDLQCIISVNSAYRQNQPKQKKKKEEADEEARKA